MPTTPTVEDRTVKCVDEQFLELVLADEQLLRAEFDAIITQAWASRPPPVRRRGASPAADSHPREPLVPPTPGAHWRRRRRPGLGGWRRQRSPPRLTPAAGPRLPANEQARREMIDQASGAPRLRRLIMLITNALAWARVAAIAPDATRATPTP